MQSTMSSTNSGKARTVSFTFSLNKPFIKTVCPWHQQPPLWSECVSPQPLSQWCELMSLHLSPHPSWTCTDDRQNSPHGHGHISLGRTKNGECEVFTVWWVTWGPLKAQSHLTVLRADGLWGRGLEGADSPLLWSEIWKIPWSASFALSTNQWSVLPLINQVTRSKSPSLPSSQLTDTTIAKAWGEQTICSLGC
jgi:hypothetical protein